VGIKDRFGLLRRPRDDGGLAARAPLAMTEGVRRPLEILGFGFPVYSFSLLLMQRGGSVYILTNRPNGVLYVGVSSQLFNRIIQHKQRVHPKSFTARYNATMLVYFEHFERIETAIAREKQIKAGSRKAKIKLIEGLNPRWEDLHDKL
jgi:putative endonuclease